MSSCHNCWTLRVRTVLRPSNTEHSVIVRIWNDIIKAKLKMKTKMNDTCPRLQFLCRRSLMESRKDNMHILYTYICIDTHVHVYLCREINLVSFFTTIHTSIHHASVVIILETAFFSELTHCDNCLRMSLDV